MVLFVDLVDNSFNRGCSGRDGRQGRIKCSLKDGIIKKIN